jgi:MoxR-like ATPase
MADLIEAGQVRQVAGKKQVLELVEEARKVYVSAPVRQYIVDLVTGLRKNLTGRGRAPGPAYGL